MFVTQIKILVTYNFQSSPRSNGCLNAITPHELYASYCNGLGIYSTSNFWIMWTLTFVWSFWSFKQDQCKVVWSFNAITPQQLHAPCYNFTGYLPYQYLRWGWCWPLSDLQDIALSHMALWTWYLFRHCMQHVVLLLKCTLHQYINGFYYPSLCHHFELWI